MSRLSPRNAIIASTGSYVPDRVLTNAYFDQLLGEDVGTWLSENLTIRERRWCTENESTADLCAAAARRALDGAGLTADRLDLIIVATDTPEYISPSTASVVQHRLQAVNAATFDLNSACAGFVTALDTGSKFIQSDERYRHVLVIGAYAMSKYLDLTDKKTVTLFADGAGAVLLSSVPDEGRGFLASRLHTDGQYHDWMGIYAGGTHQPLSEDVLNKKNHVIKFARKFPKELNVETWSRMLTELTHHLNVRPIDVQCYFFTQININSIRQTLDRLGVPHDRAHNIMDRFGYTGSACIPMAFDDAMKKGRVQPGNLVAFMGSGGGLSFACAAFRL
jgi:3-oxoacyl-[acyl-carrier-protein] synthase-3